MKGKNKKFSGFENQDSKDVLSQKELIAGVSTFASPIQPHPALETPEGKNNGAEPAIFQKQRKSHT
jgi:hypothetical protein